MIYQMILLTILSMCSDGIILLTKSIALQKMTGKWEWKGTALFSALLGGYGLFVFWISEPVSSKIPWEIYQPVYSVSSFLLYLGVLRILKRPWNCSVMAAILTLLADTLLSSLQLTVIILEPILFSQMGQHLFPFFAPLLIAVIYAGLLALIYIGFRKKKVPLTKKAFPFFLLLPTLCLVLLINLSIEQCISMYIDETRIIQFYGHTETVSVGTAIQVVSLTILAYAFSAGNLYFLSKLMDAYEADRMNALLRQQLADQETYTQEASLRYQRTKALRHDLKNHIAVTKGLLQKGEFETAASYLSHLEQSAEALSFPIETGRPAVNVILSEKLALAQQKGIETICDVSIPEGINILDFDFCILLSNALDNAIAASALVEEGRRRVDLKARKNNGFFLIDLVNATTESQNVPILFGTGLENIRATAEKYGGTISAVRTDGSFTLTILLTIKEEPSPLTLAEAPSAKKL